MKKIVLIFMLLALLISVSATPSSSAQETDILDFMPAILAGVLNTDNDWDGYTENQGDCNDNNVTIYPEAEEICGDGIDQDCSGSDEQCPICDINNLNLCTTSATCNGAGGYWRDNTCKSKSETVTNTAPVANAGVDQRIATGDLVNLNGSASSDADGDLLYYDWIFTSVPSGSSATLYAPTIVNPWFTTDLDGTYVLSLIVSDNLKNSIEDTVTINSYSDYSELFSISSGSSYSKLNGYFQPGSSFSISLNNVSVNSFVCNRAEFYNGTSLLGSTEDKSLLGGDEITNGESIGIQWTLTSTQYDYGINYKFYMTYPSTGEYFVLSYTSDGQKSAIIVPPSCDNSHLDLCVTSTECNGAGGYWWTDNTCNSTEEPFGTIISAGQVWMDRNLGASQVATSPTDSLAYGDLYQWGRGTDGHQLRTSGTTDITSSSDDPGHGDFITTSASPYDWMVPQNDNLWQGVYGTNNPCPTGFRLPTEEEWETERLSWTSNDAAGAFASPLKLVVAGIRNTTGSLILVGSYGDYWSSTEYSKYAYYLHLYGDTAATVKWHYRGNGRSIRCIEDYQPESPSCDSTHLDLCTTNETCAGASGYWWSDNTCNSDQEPPSCDSSHLDLCTTNSSCTNVGGYWWSNNTCNNTEEPTPVYEALANGTYSPTETTMYYLTMPSTGNLDLEFSINNQRTVTIYDESMNVAKPGYSSDVTHSLEAGTYIVKISGASATYTVTFYASILQ